MIDLLRARTATHHHDLETGLRIAERLSQAETRGPLIAGYATFYSECETLLGPYLSDMPDLSFSLRFHSRKIPSTTELAGLGTALVDLVLPTVGTKAEALGAMYVLEGSTLGGKIILKTLQSNGVSTDELHFLDPYGKDAGTLWRVFLSVLERETAPQTTAMNECVSGATKAFALAAACLRERGH
jgi:heme oxygenase (biliverdin-IX-beta and delta-forming)